MRRAVAEGRELLLLGQWSNDRRVSLNQDSLIMLVAGDDRSGFVHCDFDHS